MNHNLIGKIIRNRYRIIEEIDKRRTSFTFLVKDKQRSNKLFIARYFKPKLKNFQALEDAKHLFETEVSILNQLSEIDRIPKILDSFAENQNFFIIQNLIQGHKLSKDIALNKIFTQQEALKFLKSILITLVAIQKQGIIHRDINPHNLIVRHSDGKIILIDFSSAIKITLPNNQKSSSQKINNIIGTEGYIPLEQVMGNPGFYSDVHALGIVMVRILTGKLPRELISDRNRALIWEEHLSNELQYDALFLKIINKAICYDYKKRYQAAQDFLQDINKITENTDKGNKANNYLQPKNSILTVKVAKIIAGLIVIFVLLSTVVLVKQNIPKKYLVYQNQEYQIQVKYDPNWQIKQRDDFLIPGIIFLSPLENNNDPFQENVSIFVENLISEISLSEYTTRSIAEIKQFSDSTVTTTKKTTLGSYEARSIVYQGLDGDLAVKRMQVWTIYNRKVYTITYTARPDRYDEFLPIAKKMIASFDLIPEKP